MLADVETFSTKLREKTPESERSIGNQEGDGAEYFSVPVAEGERLAISAATVSGASSGATLMGRDVRNFALTMHLDDSSCFLANDFGNGIIDSNGLFFASITTKQSGAPATPEADQANKITTGSWFDDATELTADNISSVTADIVPGKTHVYKIKSEYG